MRGIASQSLLVPVLMIATTASLSQQQSIDFPAIERPRLPLQRQSVGVGSDVET